MAVTRCLPLAVIGLALLRKSFVPGSNPASARLLAKLSCLSFDRGGKVELAGRGVSPGIGTSHAGS